MKILIDANILLPRITQSLPRITKDPTDDYLIAYAVLHQADYLLTGDKKHLLPLGQIGAVKIVTPAQFLQHNERRK